VDVPVKWGILGGAHIAHAQFVPGLADARNAVLYGVASRSKARAEELKAEWGAQRAYGSYEELLADPEIEAVYIPLPNNLHHEWTVKALQRKKACAVRETYGFERGAVPGDARGCPC
jgi:predicted dehydrogenase